MNSILGNGLLLLGVVLLIIAVVNVLRSGRKARNAAYYSMRQSALASTRTWAVIAIIILAVAFAWAAFLSSQPESAPIAQVRTPTPAIATPSRMLPTETPVVVPTLPPPPTDTPQPLVVTATPQPLAVTSTYQPVVVTATPLPPPTASATPPADLPDILRTPVAGSANLADGAQLTFTTLASKVDSKGAPVDPGLTFPVGTRNIRLFFQANKVNNGAVWSVFCYKDDQLVDSVVALWKWGTRQQTARAFCALDGSSGPYRVDVYLGPYQQFSVGFELQAPEPTPTSTPVG